MSINTLVVGGTGWVGEEIVSQLLKRNDNVTLLINNTKSIYKNVEIIKTDITNNEQIKLNLYDKNFDVIFHIASLPGDTGDPRQMMDVNVNGLLNLLEFSKNSNVKRFILSSSVSALEWYPATKFNKPDYLPVDENHPCRPKDMYSSTKRMQELLALSFYHQYKVPVTILRLTAVVGPKGRGGGRGYFEMAKMLEKRKTVTIPHFNEEELCHYVDIRDVGKLHLIASEHKNAIGEIFNCCGSRPTTGKEFGDIIKKYIPEINVKCGFPWSMAQGGEISFSMKKAKDMIGFVPKYSMDESIKSIIKWIDSPDYETFDKNELSYGQGVS